MDEKNVIKRCQNGDKSAFDELIRCFYPYVSRFLLKLTCNEVLSEDLTQEIFLKIIRGIERYNTRGAAGFGTYLMTVARNTYIDYLRKNKAQSVDIDELPLADEDNFEDRVLNRLEYEGIEKYIEALPENQSRVIKLKYINQLTLFEISQLTGVPEKTVKSRIHDGVSKLRKILVARKE